MKYIILKNRMLQQLAYMFTASVLLLAACADKEDFTEMTELGAKGKVYTVSEVAGEIEVEILSNLTYEVSLVDELVDWVSFPAMTTTGDGKFVASYTHNPGFPRMTSIAINSVTSNRTDTILLKQKGGVQPKIDFKKTSLAILGGAAQIEAELDTNLELDDLDVKVYYVGEHDGWIGDNLTIRDGKFVFDVEANLEPVALRNARIELAYVNGWNEKIVAQLFLTQANAQNMFGAEATFPEVRAMDGRITEDIYIEGYVVSDAGNQNVADTPNTTATAIDYAINDRTVYVQSVDGKYGFKLVTASASDNIFTRYSKVKVLIKGANISMDPDPNRYTLSGITSSMVLSSEIGTSADIVTKEKYMQDLTDDDIFTYVTLKDCEFPVRKGPLTPVNEGYTTLFAANRVAKYPLLVRDTKGSSMYMMTNMKVPYRRDGSMLPYGAGELSGIVVHERFTRFAFEDGANQEDYGNIGRYQIRHISKDDIQLAPSLSSNFSALLTEFQYAQIVNGVLQSTNGVIPSTMTTTIKNAVIAGSTDYTYLGPCGANNKTSVNGNGVILPDGSKLGTNAATNADGKGGVASANSAWSVNNTWWNYDDNRGEAWMIETSTAGISTSQLSLQVAMMNWAVTGPVYWRAEWSTHGDMTQPWELIGKFSVPHAPVWANTALFQLPSTKAVNLSLPQSMLGNAKVYIRIMVDQNLCSDGMGYANTAITANTNCSMNYFAIRYNK